MRWVYKKLELRETIRDEQELQPKVDERYPAYKIQHSILRA